ncbi:tetratricopeptide repeat protein, partial [Thermoflexibacter ruber]
MGILRIITFIIIFFSLYQICNAQNSNQNQEVSDSLNEEQLMEDIKMAIEHYQNRQYKHAIHLFEKNIATLKAMYRDVPNLSSYLGLLNILSDCYQNTWQLEKYNELQAERDEIRMQIYENADWKVMFRIGNDLLNEGKYEKAQLVLEKLKVKTEKDFQRQSLNYIEVCNSLALLYKRRAMYDIAEKLYLEVKDICNSLLGKKSYEYVRTCNNLGMLYYEYGNYVKAELLLLEAKDILQKDIGKEDERGMYPQCCSNLGLLYIEQGLFKKAYDVLLESKDIREKIFTRKSEEYGQSCHNLALLYSRVGYYESALALYKEAKEIAEIFLGKNHPEYATYCDNLGGCYEELELYEEAESLRIEAKNIRKITLGINHPWYAYSCNNLGFFYSKRGFFKQALSLYQEALDIYEKQFGKEHTEYIKTLSNISALYYQEKLYENASPLISEAIKIEFDYLKKNLLHLSEKEKKDYFNTISSNRIGFYSILVKILENETSYKDLNVLLQNTFNFTLQSKGLMLSEVKKMKNHILHSSDTSLRNKLVAWQRYKTQISKIYNLPLADRERNTQQILFLENEINNLERYLFTKSSIFKETYENINIQLSDIQKNLKAGEVAVELIRTPLLPNDEYVFDYIGKGFSYDTLGSNGAVRVIKVISNKSPAYKIGLKINDEILSINDIITSGKSISQVSSLLKEESCKIEILSAETKSKKILIIKNDSVFVKKQADIIYLAFIITTQDIRTLLIKNAPSLETTYFQEYQKLMKVTMNPKVFEDTLLYNAFWKPIAEQLGENVKTVYLSPDGIYHQINLNTLQNP